MRIGKIRYLNCLPFYYGLEEKLREKGLEFNILEAHPARLNEALYRGEIDMAPVSSLEYLAHQDDYVLVPNLGIGAGTFARSVILFSKVKLQELNGVRIALSEESLSSATLLKILLRRRHGFQNDFVTVAQDPPKIFREHKAALLIGDTALFFESADWFYKYDLAELWREWTGEPFVFALWMVRKKIAAEHSGEVAAFLEILRDNLRGNLAEPETLIERALGVTPSDKRFAQTLGFLVNLRYELDARMMSGLSKFFELAHEEGFAPVPKALEFFK
jgi:chorismate dehydratase